MAEYIYAGGYTTNTIRKYNLSDLTYTSIESPSYGGHIWASLIHNEYIYVGGGTTTKIRRYNLSDLSYVDESPDYVGTIYSLTISGDYIYAGGGNTIKKYNLSDLTHVATSPSYGNTIFAIRIQGDYIYAGGGDTIKKYNLSDLTYTSIESPSYGDKVRTLTISGDYIYAGGGNYSAGYIKKYNLSDLTHVATSPSYGEWIYTLLVDGNYIYAGGGNVHGAGYIKKYNLSDLTYVAASPIYGNIIMSLIKDGNYFYAGGYNPTVIKKYNSSDLTYVAASPNYGTLISTLQIYNIPPTLPPSFCENAPYTISGSTCGNADGKITINDLDVLKYTSYFDIYDFTLTDITGGTYTFNTVTGEATGLTSNYYFLTATVKPEYWYYYGRETCTFDWIKIEDTDNPAFLVGVSVKPQQCGPFDRQFGRIFYNVSGLTSGNTYSFYAFTSDLSLYYSKTGITSTEDFILANASAECYWVLIRDEVTGCALLLDNRCVPSIPFFSLGGIKKLYLAKWSSDLDYNYWKDSDEDYFLEFEDTSFFTSTKIKEYLSFTGGTTGITWYELPVANKVVKLGQKLEKLRQGFIFTDTLSVAIAKYDAAKWTQMATLLNPENKWIYIMQDADGYYWTGGYLHGAKISAYNFKTGARGEDNGCTLEIQAVSENKLLVNIDENYVINYVR